MELPPYNEVYNKNVMLQTKVNNLEMELQHYKNYCIKQESVFSREIGDCKEKLRNMRNELNNKNQAYWSLQNEAVGYQNVAQKILEERNTYNSKIADLEASSQQQEQHYQNEIARLREYLDRFEQENREQATNHHAEMEFAKRNEQAWKAKWNDVDRERIRIAAKKDRLENEIITLNNTIGQLQIQESENINQLSLQLGEKKKILLGLQSNVGAYKVYCEKLSRLINEKIEHLRPILSSNDQNASAFQKYENFLTLLVLKLEEQREKIQNEDENYYCDQAKKMLDQIRNLESENERLRSGEQKCPICCIPLIFPKCTTKSCGQVYHGECILKSFIQCKKSSCPFCTVVGSVKLAREWEPVATQSS